MQQIVPKCEVRYVKPTINRLLNLNLYSLRYPLKDQTAFHTFHTRIQFVFQASTHRELNFKKATSCKKNLET